MKISFFVRTPQGKGKKRKIDWEKKVPLYVRVVDKGILDQKAITKIVVPDGAWSNKKGCIDANIIGNIEEKVSVAESVAKLGAHISEIYSKEKDAIQQKWLGHVLEDYYNAKAPIREEEVKEDTFPDFSTLFERFLAEHTVGSTQRHLSDSRIQQYEVVKRMIQRFEIYQSWMQGGKYNFDVRKIGVDDLYALHDYASREDEIFVSSPEIFQAIPEKRPPKPRCKNTLADLFNKKIRCFLGWCVDEGLIDRNPYQGFKIDGEMYGSIYYLEWSEIETIRKTDVSKFPKAQLAKDHLLVQAGIGCRVGDLMRLEKANVYNGFLHYIPNKGIHINPETVSVPILDFVAEVINRYADTPGPLLLPKMNEQEYNEQIRYILTVAKITRNVTYLDPTTRREVTEPINKVFSSHDLRRTFANKIFQDTKGNTALTASMTGHKSPQAFARYRVVSDDLKKQTIKGLNLNVKK